MVSPHFGKKKIQITRFGTPCKTPISKFFQSCCFGFFFARFGTPCKIPISKCFLKFPFRLIFARFGTTMKVVSDLN